MSTQNQYSLAHGALAILALVAAFAPAQAQVTAEVEAMIRPDSSSVGVGLSGVSGNKADRANFGQYNGFRKNSGQLDLDVDYLKRDEATGTWTTFNGRNLGNENREFGFAQQKQGDWKYSFDYGELVRNYTNTINTALQGIGTTNLTVTALGNTAAGTAAALAAGQGTGTDVDLKTTRKALSLGAEKWLTSNLLFEASFRSEKKDGARMFGRFAPCNATVITTKDGYGCAAGGAQVGNGATSTATMSAMLMLPEPISSVTRQFEAKLNYSDDKLLLSGAYYGSFYTNNFGSLSTTFNGSLWNPNGGSFSPAIVGGNGLAGANSGGSLLALPPDNQSHQLSLAGTYAITPTTRATFKYAYTHGTQKESFDSMGLTGAPRGALDGVIDTTTAQFGLTARPLPKLSLVANLRYEQRSDKTPIISYVKDATTGANTYTGKTNTPGSHTKIAGKLEASYQLPDNYRVTGGLDYDMRDLGTPTGTNDTAGQASALRAKTHEIGYRGELRKSFADNFSGAVSASHSFRNGSTWMTPGNGGLTNTSTPLASATSADGTLQGGGFNLFPLISMDLKRDKLKMSGDWSPTNDLSLQASADVSADHYFAPTMRGARDGKSSNFNVDATYKISDTWKINSWYSRNDTILDINGNNTAYMAGLRGLSHMFGLGVRGAPTGKLELGADFTASYESNRTALGVIGTQAAATATSTNGPGALPDAAFRTINLNLFAKYALDKNADIRVNFAHQRYFSNEWFWNSDGKPFFFSDGTTVTQKDQQNVTFIGAAYIYKFQ